MWRARGFLWLSVCLFFLVSVRSQTFLRSEPNTTTAADSVITFNEVMYHPAGGEAGMEWVELYNQMSVNMDVSGWRIEGGIEFRFPANTVFEADSYVVIASNPERLRAATGLTNIFGPFTNRLSSSGETLRLRNNGGRLMDELTYGDEDPWPVGADGSGASLSKRDRFNASSPAANWRASAQAGGTPGRANFDETGSAGPLEISLVGADAGARWQVPMDGGLGLNWTATDFDDGHWSTGSGSIGYDTGTNAPMVLGNVALNKAVIAGSGSYANNPFDVADAAGNFVAQNVTDGSTSDLFGENYWLGRQGMAEEHFTLDLGSAMQVEEIHLRNTHNAHHNDRGTGDFEIWASQSIDASRELVNPKRILNGRLSDVMGLDEIPGDVFTAANGLVTTSARYLRFVALTANNPGNNVGLNEVEVYAPTLAGPDRAYAFDGSFGDSSGAGMNAENMGATFSANVPEVLGRGGSVEFDGVSNQVRIPDEIDPNAYTIALWVNLDEVRSSSIILRTDDNGTRNSWSHQLRINGSGRFEHYVFDGTGRSVMATNTIVAGVWNHVAIRAASDGKIQIFVNGEQSGGATAINRLWDQGNQWRVGSDAGNAANYFRGRMDDLAIWHTELDDASIRALAAGRSPTQLGGFNRFFATDLEEAMHGKNSSAYLRIPFEHANRAPLGRLTLRVRCDDGFVAYLNGIEVLRRNAPVNLAWNSAAATDREALEAITFETIDLSEHAGKVQTGRNVLAVHALNASPSDAEFLFVAELVGEPAEIGAIENLAFSEVAGVNSAGFFIELQNFGGASVALNGCRIVSSTGRGFDFDELTAGAGEFIVLDRAQLALTLEDGDRLFLLGPGNELLDAVEMHNRGRGRVAPGPEAPWFYTSVNSPGERNTFMFRREIVINEVMYHHRPIYRTRDTPNSENDEQWIELCNTSQAAVDIGGWQLDGEVSFLFPSGTVIPPDGYLVVAGNAAVLRGKYPDIVITGDFERDLSHHSARILLRDMMGNPADEVRYHNSHPWPGYSNGGGSSLELRDPRSDNSVPEAWEASNESAKSGWRRYSYRTAAIRPVYSPSIFNFHEFRIGLLDEGEALIDNITVTEFPSGAPSRQLLQNPDFSRGTQGWRLLGNHSHSAVEPKMAGSSDAVLRLAATGNTSYLDNRLETTLKTGSTIVPVVTGREYAISFDAKWVAGSPQLRTELYYNKVAATAILDTPTHSGTPGKRNSTYVQNVGPTYNELSHFPIVPKANEPMQINIKATDPDEVAAMRVFYSVNGGAWRDLEMSPNVASGMNAFTATIPAQANGVVIQFYIEGRDGRGATSTYPGRGSASRAMIKVDSTRIVPGKQTFRTIMTPADSSLMHSAINMMSDDLLGCTVVHHEREVFYDARIRLHGSMFSRQQPNLTGMTIKFPADHRFRGTRESVIVRRRGLVENIVKHILNSAGGLPGNYDDVVHLVSHRGDNTGAARLNLANYDDTYVESQFEGDDDGTVFKLEGIREYQTTQNGNPEGLKLSQPIGWIQSFDIANFGDDPEQYRWGIMIQSDRKRDDYSRIVAMGKAFSLSGPALKEAADEAIDVDEWARLFALQNILGIGDVYGVENPHNFAFYVRPSDGRVVGLQNDWEFAFALGTGNSIYGSKNVYKVLRLPGFRRVYQGHLLDLLDSVCNSNYITPWARHYTTVIGESYNGVPGYLAARGNSVRSQLAARIPFEISSNNGAAFEVNASSATLEGRGWIDVYKVYRDGHSVPLALTWIDDQRWRVAVALARGTNEIALTAYNYRGAPVGRDTIRVSTTMSDFPQRDYIRISELMYHPGSPTLAESNAGFLDENDFEFVELVNTGPITVSLIGLRFTAGIRFDFSSSVVTNLAPSERVLVVKDRPGFELRYGKNHPVAGEYEGSLSNAGELIRLVDAAGGVIHEFAYGDATPWPERADGGGRSLEVLDPGGDYGAAANWRASSSPGGSPGKKPANPPMVSSIRVDGGMVQLSFEAEPGLTYEVLVCETLQENAWSLLRMIPPQASSRTETVTDNPTGSARFYKIRGL